MNHQTLIPIPNLIEHKAGKKPEVFMNNLEITMIRDTQKTSHNGRTRQVHIFALRKNRDYEDANGRLIKKQPLDLYGCTFDDEVIKTFDTLSVGSRVNVIADIKPVWYGYKPNNKPGGIQFIIPDIGEQPVQLPDDNIIYPTTQPYRLKNLVNFFIKQSIGLNVVALISVNAQAEVWRDFLISSRGTAYEKEVYQFYLKSDSWKETREKVLERDEHKCVWCKAPANVVHHKTYDNIGNELSDDLVSLCNPCHDDYHSKQQHPGTMPSHAAEPEVDTPDVPTLTSLETEAPQYIKDKVHNAITSANTALSLRDIQLLTSTKDTELSENQIHSALQQLRNQGIVESVYLTETGWELTGIQRLRNQGQRLRNQGIIESVLERKQGNNTRYRQVAEYQTQT